MSKWVWETRCPHCGDRERARDNCPACDGAGLQLCQHCGTRPAVIELDGGDYVCGACADLAEED